MKATVTATATAKATATATATDTWRLRGTLRIAITCLPLLGGCTKTKRGGEPPTPSPTPTLTASPAASPLPSLAAVVDAGPADPRVAAACRSTHWGKAPAAKVTPFAIDGERDKGCPTHLDEKAQALLGVTVDFGELAGFSLDGDCTTFHQASQPDACAYDAEISYPGEGRPALDHGQSVLAPVRSGTRWRRGRTPRVEQLSPAQRAQQANHWLAVARAEHASVASFARASLELMAVAAPPGLLAACARAMVDEVRHAELTFALASAYAGQPLDPGPMPALTPRGGGLVAVARDTFIEGCVAETSAVLRAQRALAVAEDPAVRAVLMRIVRDETRHAELAWQTVAWCIAEGGAEVVEAVRAAAREHEARNGTGSSKLRFEGPEHEHAHEHPWRDVIAPSLELLGV